MPAAAQDQDTHERVQGQQPQLRMVNSCSWAEVTAGAWPSWTSSHCTGLPVTTNVSRTAITCEASHSPCSNATSPYQPTTAQLSRNRPPRAAANSAPRIAVHSPCPNRGQDAPQDLGLDQVQQRRTARMV
jgi:hypothetical protein